MRKSKFTDQEIEAALERVNKGASIEDIAKKMGVTLATVYNWKKKIAAGQSDKTEGSSRLKDLEEENMRLKQLVANLSLEKQDLLDVINKKTRRLQSK